MYARSAGDDKAPIIAILAAFDSLQAANTSPSVNLKFFFEGEEEASSPHLASIFDKYADLLKADVWLLCDGPVHQTRRMQVYFGVRGITELQMTVYGPNRALHSGHYGNWAPNPIALLINLLSTMRDVDGNIQIKGFYDDVRPLTKAEQDALAEVPNTDADIRRELALTWTEGSPRLLAELITRPAMNFRGIKAGHVGEKTTNSISTEATVSIDFRLVPDQSPDRVRTLIEQHISQQGFFIVHQTPTMEVRQQHAKVVKLEWGNGYPASRTSMDLPISKAVVRTIEESLGQPAIKLPTLGGSVPMYLFVDKLKAPVVGLPIVNHDNNQHAANENLRLQNLWDGIDIFSGLLGRLGQIWK